ncbi:hypothetical protein ACJ7V3_17755 [Halomonas elongata]|uniref:hypothetical protein n=1 Tax=Halomonas elongata TaxID=2746 RepID=UPI0038D3F870
MSDSTIRPMTFDEIDIVSGGISYDQAYQDFQEGGQLLGAGAGKLVASAWTGIALTPALIADSLGLGTSLPGGLPELP